MKTPQELFNQYVLNGATMCSRILHVDEATLIPIIQRVVQQRMQSPKIDVLETVREGKVERRVYDLWEFTKLVSGRVITPSGSVYKTSEEHEALLPRMLKDFTNTRDELKGKQLKAKATHNGADVTFYKNQQSSIKINTNAAPGGMGSEYNCLYDIGNYNAVTSSGRFLVASAYTLEEQLLYGNFAFFDASMLMNHIVLLIRNTPDRDKIKRVMFEFQLKQPTHELVFTWLHDLMKQYCKASNQDLNYVHDLIFSLNPEELSFVWYYQNLNHIIWWNEETFKDRIKKMVNPDNYPDIPTTVDMYNSLDKDLIVMLTVLLSSTTILEGVKPEDLQQKSPEKFARFLSIAIGIQKEIEKLNSIFDVFVHVKILYPRINSRKSMIRRSTTNSDTDSIIFSTLGWVMWYTGRYGVTNDAYSIVSVIIYWLTKSIAPVLYEYSSSKGATGKGRYIMRMKNEFLFVAMMIFPLMKHYASLQVIQEGVIFKSPEMDIKGVGLKGSTMCQETRDFVEQFIRKYVLEPVMTETLDVSEIIKAIIAREKEIADSIQKGETTYLKIESISIAADYNNKVESTSFQYLVAWNEIFGNKYETIAPPGKFSVVELTDVTDEYLNTIDPEIKLNFINYKIKFGKYPGYIALNPMMNGIPKELIGLVNLRKVVYHNVRPLHMCAEGLNCGIGFTDRQLLFSDVYKA